VTFDLGDLKLTSLQLDDAARLLALLDENRTAFDPWLRWSGTVWTVTDAQSFIAASLERERARDGFHLGIRAGEDLAGGVICWSCDAGSRRAEVGYWVGVRHRRRGLAERASRRVIEHLFAEYDVDQVELQCLTDNIPSRRLAERLGGRLEKIHRPPVAINGRERDHALYVIERGP
jgi:ribosomal-protein-serine acetyltransferase